MSKLNKGTVETIKTVVIAVLVTAVVAFIGGMQYAQRQEARVNNAVKSAQAQVATPVATEVKK